MFTTQSATVTDPKTNQRSTGLGFSLMAPNDTTVPTMRDIYGQPTQPTSLGNPVHGNSVSETLARMRMAHVNPLPPSMAVPDMWSNNTAYAALPPTTSMIYPAPNTIVNAATKSNSPAVQTTFSLPTSKAKKISSRPKHTDNALQDDCAAPAEKQKRVCVLKLTYHRGVENENENSLTQRMTEILGYRPATNAYEKRGGELKADSSKFAMPNLDKTLCERVVCKLTIRPPRYLATNAKANRQNRSHRTAPHSAHTGVHPKVQE